MQESGFTEILLLMGTRYLGASVQLPLGCRLMTLDGRNSSLPEFPQSSSAHHSPRLQLLVTMDLTEAEDIKNRWQGYTEELYKTDFNDSYNHQCVITHLEPDILECEVKWALESISVEIP